MNELRDLSHYRHIPGMLMEQTPEGRRPGLSFELSLVRQPKAATRMVCVRVSAYGRPLTNLTAEDALLPGPDLSSVEAVLSRAWSEWRSGAGWRDG